MSQHTIGIDVGGTFIKAGLLDSQSVLGERREIATEAHAGFEHVLRRIADVARELNRLVAGGRASGIGIGVPGPMSHREGIVHNAPNLPGWTNVPVRARLAEMIGLPVALENDANAAAFGEYVAGAGRAARSMVLMTLGTGIGAGVVLDGALWRGDFDSAGEIGHMLVERNGRECPCGQRGCLERYASASAIADRYCEAHADGAGGATPQGDATHAPAASRGATQPSAREIARLAASGDALASRVWDEACEMLALACVNVQHLFNPQRVVFAGGLIKAGAQLLEPIRRHFDRLSWRIAPDRPTIELATLGEDAGWVGAAALAREVARFE